MQRTLGIISAAAQRGLGGAPQRSFRACSKAYAVVEQVGRAVLARDHLGPFLYALTVQGQFVYGCVRAWRLLPDPVRNDSCARGTNRG
jgi:hypothetical protein